MAYVHGKITSFLLNVAEPGVVETSKTAGTRAGINLVGSPPPAGPAITSTVHGESVIQNTILKNLFIFFYYLKSVHGFSFGSLI